MGLGGDQGSLATGNAGARRACGIVEVIHHGLGFPFSQEHHDPQPQVIHHDPYYSNSHTTFYQYQPPHVQLPSPSSSITRVHPEHTYSEYYIQ